MSLFPLPAPRRPILKGLFTFTLLALFAMPLDAQKMSLSTYYGSFGSTSGMAIATDAAGNAFEVSTTSSSLPCSGTLNGTQAVLVTMVNHNRSLGWCTYVEGTKPTGTDYGYGITLDAEGDVYVVGMTDTPGLATAGAYQTQLLGAYDAFVAELDPTGKLLWFTYLGTGLSSQANSVWVDSSGAVYITGYTTGSVWPVAGGVSQKSYGGGAYDIVVAKLNAGGSTLSWSGYLGGSGDDVGYSLALSPDGSLACLDGYTTSHNYPATPGAFQTTTNATHAAVVTCLNPATGATTASTYFGGSSTSNYPCTACAAGLTFDASGNVWIVGLAQNETGFPITPDAAQPVFAGGNHDAFISELTSDLSTSSLLYSTWFGGSGDDGAVAAAFDADGNLWIHGNTYSQDLPVSANAFQLHNGGLKGSDAFLLEMSPATVEYATYLGGSEDEFAAATQSLAIDPDDIWFTGWTQSANLPLVHPFDSVLRASQAAFVAALKTTP